MLLVIAFGVLRLQSVNAASSKKPIDFTLRDINGKQVILSNYRGKVVVVDVWATWCGFCVGEIPHLMSLQSKAGQEKTPLQFLGIAMDDNRADVRNFVAQRRMNYPVLYPDSAQMKPFGEIDGLPTKFIIDKKGVIVNSIIGAASEETITQHVAKYLK